MKIIAAIDEAWSESGVAVLVDLAGAVDAELESRWPGPCRLSYDFRHARAIAKREFVQGLLPPSDLSPCSPVCYLSSRRAPDPRHVLDFGLSGPCQEGASGDLQRHFRPVLIRYNYKSTSRYPAEQQESSMEGSVPAKPPFRHFPAAANPVFVDRVRSYLNSLIRTRDFDSCHELLDRLIAHYPDHHVFFGERARVYRAQGSFWPCAEAWAESCRRGAKQMPVAASYRHAWLHKEAIIRNVRTTLDPARVKSEECWIIWGGVHWARILM